ncbi:MAG: nuclear transport factor 2 family protein [Chloroflexota bacterium]
MVLTKVIGEMGYNMTDQAIINTVNQMAFSADIHDWAQCRSTFADEIFVDYTSMAGGKPATIPADALIDSWQGLLPGFTATQHLLGTHIIEVNGDSAVCDAHFQATHVIDEESWTLGGRYQFNLQYSSGVWQITGITMTVLWSAGDQASLLARAAERTV